MASDEQRRQVHLDLVELKNLQTIVFDLEELKQLHFIAKRSRVRSILSREISNLKAKIVSNSTYSDEKPPEEENGKIKLAEMGSKRKRKEIYKPQSSKMKKRTKLINIIEPHVMNGSSYKSTEEERNQQSLQTRNSEQVLRETANPSDVNKASPMPVVATENADASKKTSQTTPLPGAAAFSGYRLGSPGKMSWCHRCQLPIHAESECLRCNGTCFKCRVRVFTLQQHLQWCLGTVCTKASRDGISSSGAKTVTAAGSCQCTQDEPNQQSLPTGTSEQVLWKNTNPSVVNEASLTTVVATESADVSNKTSQTTPSPATTSTSGSRRGRYSRRPWCRTCQLRHAESECSRYNDACVRCHKAGHFLANCPKVPRDGISPSGMRTVTAGSICERMQRMQKEMHQQSLLTRTSEQVLPKANSSDVNKTSTMIVVATENADVSNSTSQTTPSPATIAASGSRLGRSCRRPWCCTCRLLHAESECLHQNGPCVNCHGAGHFVANCPKVPRDGINSGGARTFTAGIRCESMQEELHQQSVPTRTSEQVLLEKTNSSDVNETSTMAVVATENADVSNKTMPSPATTAASGSRLGGQVFFGMTGRHSRRRPRRSRRNGPCVNCHETGHVMENCPKPPRYVISPSGTRTVTVGSRCESMQEELHQQSLPTRTSQQVLPEKANSSDVNETSAMAVVATENAVVSNKTIQTMSERGPVEGKTSQQRTQTTTSKGVRPSSLAIDAASKSRLGYLRRKRACFKCCRTGHFAEECAWPPQNAINPIGRTIIAVGGNTGVHALLYEEPWEETYSIRARKIS